MLNAYLPEKITGDWIWLKDNANKGELHTYFRRDFSIDELPGSAEIWFSAGSFCHLFINGRHCTGGPVPSPEGVVNCQFVDVTYLLHPGVNQIAVLVFHSRYPLAFQKGQLGGFWMQMNMDGKPYLWTNSRWRCMEVEGYQQSAISQFYGGMDMEYLDFRRMPHNWKTYAFTPYKKDAPLGPDPSSNTGIKVGKFTWFPPNQITSLDDCQLKIVVGQNFEDTMENCSHKGLVGYGYFGITSWLMWVNFRDLVQNARNGGIFIAQTYLQVAVAGVYEVECYCDRPYRLFLNDVIISEQVPPSPPIRVDHASRGNRKLNLTEYAPVKVRMELSAGWNHLFLVEDCDSHGHGMTLVCRECQSGDIIPHTEAKADSPSGWTICGPMRSPFSLLLPNLYIDSDVLTDFILADNRAWDISVALRACTFVSGNGECEQPTLLIERQYRVFDFGRVIHGYPCLELRGSAGDVVDVICGENFIDGAVVAYEHERRYASTLIMNGDDDSWIPCSPLGFRYIMVIGRQISHSLSINQLYARNYVLNHERGSAFSCNDQQINKIWKVGENTLNNTMYGGFIESPSRDHCQYIFDAMVQSWACYHLFGDFSYVENSIRAFAASQYETGSLNAIAPSSLFYPIPIYGLMWIIWVHRHYIYTGDIQFLTDMMSVVERLLAFYNTIAVEDDSVLYDMCNLNGTFAKIDFDDTIESRGISTGLNAMYCHVLQLASQLADCQGFDALSVTWQERAMNVAGQIRALNFDMETGLFYDSYFNDSHSGTATWQTNVMALFGGLTTEEESNRIWDYFFCDEYPYTKTPCGNLENPGFKYFLLEVASQLGKDEWIMKFMKSYWGGMLEKGATTWWEFFSLDENADLPSCFSYCHGYGVSPNAFIVSSLCGISPITPGFAKVYFHPNLNLLKSVHLQLPTPRGSLTIAWQTDSDESVTIDISPTFQMELMVDMSQEDADRVTFNVNDNVSIV